MTRVLLADYGVGNLHSVRRALENAGVRVAFASPAGDLSRFDAVVLPGVGAFGPAAARVARAREPLRAWIEAGRPLLGICLGMQLLFDDSEESPGVPGLGVLAGPVRRLPARRLPQIGWNDLAVRKDPLFEELPPAPQVYFVNSFAPVPREDVTIATAEYGSTFCAAVRKRNAYGVQFHPEKSSRTGLRMIENFLELARESS
ncbi:MAG TPA: imidazole glycerol phosphate synthase subunit HisH [Candidatus Thermoplasmatota archaeon]|nr:imidazole glycerol phosphate synthase subunit HisH [Candidatus Thermoplasmatota archaeon]